MAVLQTMASNEEREFSKWCLRVAILSFILGTPPFHFVRMTALPLPRRAALTLLSLLNVVAGLQNKGVRQ